jgi:hypothetical protein
MAEHFPKSFYERNLTASAETNENLPVDSGEQK